MFRPAGGSSRLTPRRVLSLCEHPREGGPLWASKAAALPPDDVTEPGEMSWHGWTFDRHLRVAMVEILQTANWQRGSGKGRAPKPLPRPKSPARRMTGRDYLRRGMAGRGHTPGR